MDIMAVYSCTYWMDNEESMFPPATSLATPYQWWRWGALSLQTL